jgi:hypothetical protein
MPTTNRLLFALEPRQTLTYHLRDAFKTNAWMQISHLTADEAEQYIEIINSLVKNNTINEKISILISSLLLLSFVVSCNNKN